MKARFYIQCRIILPAVMIAAAWANATVGDPASTIAPMVDEQTFAVVRLDVARLDLPALAKWGTSVAGELPVGADEGVKRIDQWQRSFLAAGGREIYVILSLADLPAAMPPIIVPVPAGADGEAIAAALGRRIDGLLGPRSRPAKGAPSGPFGYHGSIFQRGGLVIGAERERTLDRLRTLEPSPRADLAAAFAAAGDAPIQVVLVPSADQRRVLAETLPQLPPPLPPMSGARLTQAVQWAALGVKLPPAPSVRLVIQSADAEAAAALGNVIAEALAAVAQLPPLREAVPEIEKATRMLTPAQSGSRLTLELSTQRIDEFVDMILTPAMTQARQNARLDVSVANLRAIGQALAMYAQGHEGQSPPDLQTLVDARWIDTKHLISLLSGKAAYIYIRPSKRTRDIHVVVYEDPDTHGLGRTPVLFRGTNVKVIQVDDRFREMVAEAKRRSAETDDKGNSDAPSQP